MTTLILFDVDGTLTESYQVKSPEDTIEILEKLFFK